MEKDETYNRYHRFLAEVERKFCSSIIGKSDEEKWAMLRMTEKIVDSFVDLYGDGGVKETLLLEARIVLAQQVCSSN